MPNFISVLDADMGNLGTWIAVQQNQTLDGLRNDPFYTAGEETQIPRLDNHRVRGSKTVTETSTNTTANVQMIQLAIVNEMAGVPSVTTRRKRSISPLERVLIVLRKPADL